MFDSCSGHVAADTRYLADEKNNKSRQGQPNMVGGNIMLCMEYVMYVLWAKHVFGKV